MKATLLHILMVTAILSLIKADEPVTNQVAKAEDGPKTNGIVAIGIAASSTNVVQDITKTNAVQAAAPSATNTIAKAANSAVFGIRVDGEMVLASEAKPHLSETNGVWHVSFGKTNAPLETLMTGIVNNSYNTGFMDGARIVAAEMVSQELGVKPRKDATTIINEAFRKTSEERNGKRGEAGQ